MILVVGATGNLGGAVTRLLLAQGQPVRILARPQSNYQPLAEAGAQVVPGDLKQRNSLDAACQGVDTVITTANSFMRGGEDTVQTVDLRGNRHLIEAAKAGGVKQFIFVSVFPADASSPVPFFAVMVGPFRERIVDQRTPECQRWAPGAGVIVARIARLPPPLRKEIPMSLRIGRLAVTVLLILVAAAALVVPPAPAAEDVKIALVAPLSGRWARQGQLKKMGADMAIEEINSQGGIKALGGAKIVLREADAGDSVEKAVSAAQRVLTREKISAGIGSWLSSFTLGVTEVAERLQVPWLTLSYADSITERGFKYTFQTSPVSSVQAEQALELVTELAKKNNRPIKKAAIVGDNTAATVFFFKPLREKLLAAKGIELVVDEVWTPPLADATAIAQKLRATQPDIVFYGATNFPDSIQVLQKVKEFSVKAPIQGVGAWLVTPEYVKTLGKEMLDSIQTVVATHPMKGQEEIVKRFTQRTGEPFMTQDPLCTYGHVWLIKEAIEQAKSADPKAIRDALAKIDVTSGPAATSFYPNRIKFDERGRRVGATPLIVQWQGGEPFTVVPTAVATRPVAWHK